MKSRARAALVLIVLIAGGVWAVLRYLSPREEATSDVLFASGTVEATEAHLGFQVSGRLESIAVREGDRVATGEALAELDRTEMLARRQEAEARVAASRALLRELEGGFRREEVEQAKAARDAARERLGDAEQDLDRTKRLYEGGAVSREAYDKALLGLELAQAQLTQAAEQLSLLEAGPRPEKVEAQRAQLAQAEASVRALDASIDMMRIVAPFGGVVTVRHREAGEIVAPGTAVLTVMNSDDRWVRIYVREDRIGAVKIGMAAEVSSDTYPDKSYPGRVSFIASEAEFTPKNVQTTEERVKLVYAVKVHITEDSDFDLKPGMPADVRLRGTLR
ncbi:MAG TPA: efflux RND transporter periplasmic adaptor subunit [Vicinamibacteria bacterium]|nr:efflux RND transporter periplasmic adaptor subunit [Vicinamibacteria bacterium]